MLTTTEQLEEVQAAITACLTSQAYQTPGGASQRRADLDALTAREEKLIKRLAAESHTQVASVLQIDQPA